MTVRTPEELTPRPLYQRAIRFVVVGVFTILLLYVKAIAAILKVGLAAIKKIPENEKKHDGA